MGRTLLLCLLAGLLGGNGIPHFVRGITKRPYPSVLGSGPVTNLIGGWVLLLAAGAALMAADAPAHPVAALLAGATGVLLIGLFHAGHGAVGRP